MITYWIYKPYAIKFRRQCLALNKMYQKANNTAIENIKLYNPNIIQLTSKALPQNTEDKDTVLFISYSPDCHNFTENSDHNLSLILYISHNCHILRNSIKCSPSVMHPITTDSRNVALKNLVLVMHAMCFNVRVH